MRTNEERLAALHKRAAELEQEKRRGNVRIIQAVSVAACFAAVILLAFIMPGFTDAFVAGNSQGSMSASVFSGSRATGFIVIGVLAFLLGVAVTVFCFRLKRRQDEEEGLKSAEKTKKTGEAGKKSKEDEL